MRGARGWALCLVVLASMGAACGGDEAPARDEAGDRAALSEANAEAVAEIEALTAEYAAADSAKEICSLLSELFKRFLTDEKPETCAKHIKNSPDWTTEPVDVDVNDIRVVENKAMAEVTWHEPINSDDRIWYFNEHGTWKVHAQGMQPPPEWEGLLDLEPLDV